MNTSDQNKMVGHGSHLSGPISGPVHTGSGNIFYNVTPATGKQTEFDISRFTSLYKESILKSPELTNVSTPLGSVDIHKLYVMPRLAPVNWLHGSTNGSEDSDNEETALEVIDRFQRMVIFGTPGIGKSSFLKFVLHHMLDRQSEDGFPILLSLYQYVERHNTQDLLSWAIVHYFQPIYQGEELEALGVLLRQWNSEGKLVFLLDGLDEVPIEKRESLLGQIRNLPRFVLTSRPRGRVDANQESGANYDICAFAQNEVGRFVRNWQDYQVEQAESEPFSANEFFNYIRREPRIADLVRVPQLLTVLCWLWGRGKTHRYGTKGELLVEAADQLIDKAMDLSGLSEESRLTVYRDLRNGLGGLALDMLLRSRQTISREEFINFFEDVQSSELGKLLMLAQRSGLLIPTSGREDEWRFIHLVFQEFLAAEAIARHPDFENFLDQVLARVDFEECLRITCGLLCKPNLSRYTPRLKVLIDRLLSTENTDIFNLNWRMAGLCISEVDAPERQIGNRLGDLEHKLLECSSEWWARQRFVEAMGRLRTTGMRQLLVDALVDENPYARWSAAEALSQLADPATLDAILARIEEEDWQIIQGALASALGRIGDRKVLPAIKGLLEKPEENLSLWQGIGETLGRFEDIETLLSLTLAAEEDKYGFSKAAIVNMSAYPYLSDEAHMRLHQSLDQNGFSITGDPADAYVLTEPTLEELHEKAYTEDPAARVEAVLALGQMGSSDAIFELLLKLLDEDETVYQTVGRTLRNMADDAAALVFAFQWALGIALDERNDSELRETMAESLSQLWYLIDEREAIWQQREELRSQLTTLLRDPSAMEKLLSFLDSDQRFLVPAIWTLGILGNSQDAIRLVPFLEHQSDLVRWAAAWATGELGDMSATQALLKRIDPAEDIDVLRSACESAGKLGIKEAVQPLARLLDASVDIAVRVQAIKSLGQIGDIEPAGVLLKVLSDTASEVRVATVEALGKIGWKQAVPSLLGALEDSSPAVQIAAATALGNFKDPHVESKLIACLASENPDLRYALIESLSSMGGKTATAQLRDLLENDPDEECASSAAETFAKLADTSEILDLINRVGDEYDANRMSAIASAILNRDDMAMRNQILECLKQRGINARVGRNYTIVQLNTNLDTLTSRSEDFLQQFGEEPGDREENCIERLFEDDEVVRWEATVALADEEMSSVSTVAPLIVSMITDQDLWVARGAAEALANISEEFDDNEQIRSERTRALTFLKEQGDLAAVLEWLDEFDPDTDTLTRMVRWALQDLQALPPLIQAHQKDNTQARLILWEIGDYYSLRFMPTGEVILPTGMHVSYETDIKSLLSQE